MEIKPSQKSLRVCIYAMDGTGHLNACVGVAEALVKRGHSILFLVNAAFKGQFAKFGFEEFPMERSKKEENGEKEAKKPEDHVNPVKAFAKMILNMGLLSEKTPLERMKELSENRAKGIDKDEQFAKNLYESTTDFNLQIKRAFEEFKPHLVIVDHFLIPPCLPESGLPWLYLFSGNPIAIYSSITSDLPPFATGYPTDGDRAEWEEYLVYQRENAASFTKYQRRLYEEANYEPKPEDLPVGDGGIFPQCKYYILGYPKELDYQDLITIPENFIRLDAFCRETKPTEPFKLPEGFAEKDDKLIYFSLGSMGSVDVDLVKRVTSILSSKTPYKTIVSKGPLADEFELPERCWGEGFLPQTQLLPLVDLVITHGGNNTVTETFSFGKPMIVLPLFGDQFDNAQRVFEKGYGRRLETYRFTDQELVDAVEALINDQQLKERLEAAAKRIAADRSKEVACMKIEAIAEKYAK